MCLNLRCTPGSLSKRLSDANGVGWCPELGEWACNQEINSPFLAAIPLHPREDVGTRIAGCLFQQGKGGGIESRLPNNISEVLIFAKHLSLNCWVPTHLPLPPSQ